MAQIHISKDPSEQTALTFIDPYRQRRKFDTTEPPHSVPEFLKVKDPCSILQGCNPLHSGRRHLKSNSKILKG
jgi:hypothetical protein